jgi:metal-sulfur cluster biosynthetic enzyme
MEPLNEARVRAALCSVLDPEVGINIVDLGLVYAIEIDGSHVRVQVTLTSAGCPMGGSLIEEIEDQLARAFPSDTPHAVDVVWEPPWSPERMSPAAKQALGWQP